MILYYYNVLYAHMTETSSHIHSSNTHWNPSLVSDKKIGGYLKHIGSKNLSDFVQETLTEENTFPMTDMLRRLNSLFKEKTYTQAFFRNISEENLEKIFSNPHIDIGAFIALWLLPTPLLMQELFWNNLEEIKKQQKVVKNKGFNRDEKLHRELEYSKYCLYETDLHREFWDITLEDFHKIPWLGDTVLSSAQHTEIDNIAKDNVEILNFIKEEAKKWKVLVLFNKRYGDDYVWKAIEMRLRSNKNIKTTKIYARSTFYDDAESLEKYQKSWKNFRFDDKTQEYVDTDNPTIIVIDGTEFTHTWWYTHRFPAAMNKVLHDMKQMGEYNLRFFIPNIGEISETVSLGWYAEYSADTPNTDTSDFVILRANWLSKWSLDDPEDSAKKLVLAFGEAGIEKTRAAYDTDIFMKILTKTVAETTRELLK